MNNKHYANTCPTCEQSFMCEHPRDTRCPYCRIAELEVLNRRLTERWEGAKLRYAEDSQRIEELEAKHTAMVDGLRREVYGWEDGDCDHGCADHGYADYFAEQILALLDKEPTPCHR